MEKNNRPPQFVVIRGVRKSVRSILQIQQLEPDLIETQVVTWITVAPEPAPGPLKKDAQET